MLHMLKQCLGTAVEPEDQKDLWEITLVPGRQAELPLTLTRQMINYVACKEQGMGKNTHILPQSLPSHWLP